MKSLAQALNLQRPLVVLDTETTGTNPETDRVIELAVLKIHPDGTEQAWEMLFHPGCPIPPSAMAVHGITDADVAGQPPFASKAGGIYRAFMDCDLAGYNVRFDVAILAAEFRRAGGGPSFPGEGVRCLDALRIWHRVAPRNLDAALQVWCGRAPDAAHRAGVDVRMTHDVLAAQLAMLPEMGSSLPAVMSVDGLADWQRDPSWVDDDGKFHWQLQADGTHEAAFAFGKHEGRTLRWIALHARDYLRWMLVDASGFSAAVLAIAREAEAGRFPQKG